MPLLYFEGGARLVADTFPMNVWTYNIAMLDNQYARLYLSIIYKV